MRNRPQSLMIFAAGRGTRMAPLTDKRPKPLVRVAGRALLDHALELGARVPRIVVNTHYLADQIDAHLADHAVATVFEPELLETGGGLRNARPLLGEGPVLTLNSDAVWRGPNVLHLLAEAWDPSQMEALVAVVAPDQAQGHVGTGDFLLDATGRVSRGAGLIYSGAQITKTDRLDAVGEPAFSMNVIWDKMIAAGTLYGLPYPGRWCDVGRPESIPLAEAMLGV